MADDIESPTRRQRSISDDLSAAVRIGRERTVVDDIKHNGNRSKHGERDAPISPVRKVSRKKYRGGPLEQENSTPSNMKRKAKSKGTIIVLNLSMHVKEV
jgi:hypothetical protein